MCAICGLPDYTRCDCQTTQPFCDQCEQDERCGQIMDAHCVIYHPDDDQPTKLTCLGLENKVSVEQFMEAVDAKICQFFQVQLQVVDTPTVDLTLIGKQLKADVKISPDAGNQIQARANGLFSVPFGESFKVKVDAADAPEYLENQITGGTDGIVTVSVLKRDGLLVIQPAIDILCLLNKIKTEYLEEFCKLADACKCFHTIMNLTKTFAPACPDGYTLNAAGTLCEKIETATPSFPGQPIQACNSQRNEYGTFGALVYTGGFLPNGNGIGPNLAADLASGNVVSLPLGSSVWRNNAGGNNRRGPVNRTGLWQCGGSGVQRTSLGFVIPIQVPTTKTYFVGIAGDDSYRLDINGTTIITRPGYNEAGFNPGVTGYYNSGNQVNFNFFHIYPVSLNAGINYIYVIGTDTGGISSVFSAEVYDATLQQLQNAQFVPQFNEDDPDNQSNVPYGQNYYSNLNLIFTTRCGRAPGTIFSYTSAANPCPAGYNLDTSGGAVLTPPCQGMNSNVGQWICRRVSTVPFSGYNATLVFDKIPQALSYEIQMKPTGSPDSSYVPVPGSPFPNQAGTIVTIQLSNLPSNNLTFRARPNYGDCYGDWVTI